MLLIQNSREISPVEFKIVNTERERPREHAILPRFFSPVNSLSQLRARHPRGRERARQNVYVHANRWFSRLSLSPSKDARLPRKKSVQYTRIGTARIPGNSRTLCQESADIVFRIALHPSAIADHSTLYV